MSIALWPEPIDGESREAWDKPWEPCLLIGMIDDEEGVSALIVRKDGGLDAVDRDHVRTKWRYDYALKDFIDATEEPDAST